MRAKIAVDAFARSLKGGVGLRPWHVECRDPINRRNHLRPLRLHPMRKKKQVSVPPTPVTTAYCTWYEFDATRRITKAHQPNNAETTQYEYSGNTVKVIDTVLAWKTFTMDAMENLTQVTEPNPAGGTFITNYTYSTLNQPLTASMQRPSVPGGGTVTQTCTFAYYNSDQRLQS